MSARKLVFGGGRPSVATAFAGTCLALASTGLAQDRPEDWPQASGAQACCKGRALELSGAPAVDVAREHEVYCEFVERGWREAYEDTDVLHCGLEIEVDPNHKSLAGTNTLRVRSNVDALSFFTIRLDERLLIDAALINGQVPVEVSPASPTTRIVTLDRAYAKDETFDLAITYHGQPQSGGFGSIRFTWVVYTLSQPYYAFTWWPVKDGDLGAPGDNSDKFTFDLWITSPPGYHAASNGMLVSARTLEDGRELHHWSTHYPLSAYLAFFATARYDLLESKTYVALDGREMPVLFYDYNILGLQKIVLQALPVYAQLFGEYPFVEEKYGIYRSDYSGGMEHQTFTMQGYVDEYTTVHELAHQWWGDLVTCRTWNDIWLNEGFATYAEALWAEHKPGSKGLPSLLAVMESQRGWVGSGPPYMSDEECKDYRKIFNSGRAYYKGSWVLHMLRYALGDENFFAALRAYRNQYAFKTATTTDFQTVCEAVHGRSLGWFFNAWVYKSFGIIYNYSYKCVRVADQDYLLLCFENRKDPNYEMPIELLINNTLRYRIDGNAAHRNYLLPYTPPFQWLSFDPDRRLLYTWFDREDYNDTSPLVLWSWPAPGALVQPEQANEAISIVFDQRVATIESNYTLVGKRWGKIPVRLRYDPNSLTATLRRIGAPGLLPDTYTLTVDDLVFGSAHGAFLDGEVRDPQDPRSLPSGDGHAGGDAVWEFAIDSRRGDMNCDGQLNFADINPFLLAWESQVKYETKYPYCRWRNADCDGDGQLTVSDIDAFVDLLRS